MLKTWEQVMKALGQSTRLRIVLLLAKREHCTSELEQVLTVSQPAISQHMRVLKSLDLVNERRDGAWTFYSLNRRALGDSLSGLLSALDDPSGRVADMQPEWERDRELEQHPLVSARA